MMAPTVVIIAIAVRIDGDDNGEISDEVMKLVVAEED